MCALNPLLLRTKNEMCFNSIYCYPLVFLQMVSLLLRKGATVSAKDKKERQAIHWAAYCGKASCCLDSKMTERVDF